MESISDVVRDKLIAMDGEIRQLHADLKREKRLTEVNQEMIQELEDDNRSLVAKLASASTSNVDISSIKEQLEHLREEKESLLEELQNVTTIKDEQSRELQAARKQIDVLQLPAPVQENTGEKSISDRELELMESNSQLRNELMDLKTDFASNVEANNLLRQQMAENLETIENLEGNFGEIKRLLRESKEQIRDLEAELQEARTTDMAKSGNSIFAEFDDIRKKNEGDLKNLFCENKALQRHIHMLTNEMEELRLLGGRAAFVEVRGRCVCEDQKFEMIKLRSEVQKFRQKYLSAVQEQKNLMSNMMKRTKSSADVLLRSHINTLECNYRSVMEDFESTCKDNNALKDKTVELNSRLRRSEREIQSLNQELEMMKKRTEIARNRKEREENSEDMEKPSVPDSSLSALLGSSEKKPAASAVESLRGSILRAHRVLLETPSRAPRAGIFKQPILPESATKNEQFFSDGAERIKQLTFAEPAEDFESDRRQTMTNAEKRRISRVTNKKKVEPKVKSSVSKTIVIKDGVRSVVDHSAPRIKGFAPSLLDSIRPKPGSVIGQSAPCDPNDTMDLFTKGDVKFQCSSTDLKEDSEPIPAGDPYNVTCADNLIMDFSSLEISQSINRNALSNISVNAGSTTAATEDFFTSFNKERLLSSHFSEGEEDENDV